MWRIEQLISGFDTTLRTLAGVAKSARPDPGRGLAEGDLDAVERRHSAGLMRVNHVGEVCAQALYTSQSLFATSETVRRQFEQAAREEEEHLAWTAQRLHELGARPSLLNPLWFAGAFAIGAVAARLGDAHSLAFVVETERQVEAHLASHLDRLPAQDARSRAIVDQMRADEIAHGAAAAALGAAPMPALAKSAMRAMAKVMTAAAYRL